MIFRRIKAHIEKENWFAVFLDFLIVVSGVVIGVQIGNWNADRQDHQAYEQALERYRAEIELNLATLDTVDEGVEEALVVVADGFDALLACEEIPANRLAVERAINKTMGTYGINLRDQALLDLTAAATYLDQQSEADRERFGNTRHRMEIFLREADYIEKIPLQERAQNNPVISVGSIEERRVEYQGTDYSRADRTLALAVPLDVACKDDMLLKSLYTWERWQRALPAVSRILRQQLEEDLAYLEERQ
ncbi:hypothetical protein FF098_009725 [Parvularcula flava]|uniref:Uncharacterized protein n=1 Tax=Aquisalinus luteolus TaxID=1566827 RepID=A0A8J3EPH2_9PROT|nr:hypothetical protein [Aquisalinus luteolus]NHK28181.1 hypothetical protein [Aquisalinus luteolus]GGH97708.1 hypothetical protein GCM10011355_19580 [Aquisalinus luteolus]